MATNQLCRPLPSVGRRIFPTRRIFPFTSDGCFSSTRSISSSDVRSNSSTCSTRPTPTANPAQTRAQKGFARLKMDFLTKPDKSGAGGFDEGVVDLCKVLNDRIDIFTTSSCAGRALLWLGDEPPSKKSTAERLVRPLVLHDAHRATDRLLEAVVELEAEEVATVWLRYEPLVLHCCCSDWTSARWLVTAARSAGLKRASLFGQGPWHGPAKSRYTGDEDIEFSEMQSWRVAIEGEDRLEMPIVVAGQRAFNFEDPKLRSWLEKIVDRKFERNAERLQKLLLACTE
eukprot:TRINITY_DN3055_c4_g1_i1.p1 TRINITY_DN3055_c4_g1~~TRINITY_DN3055_c4_g1_i1.p1  ORF type:complete len:286 (+),score=55.06 TRINITY_DN3055_c4_g1_i1:99-956(+)